jgi:hypothetical protein
MALHGGTKNVKGVLHRGAPKPEATHAPYHVGSGAPKTTHAPPPAGGTVNRFNYASQQIKRK